MKQNKLRTLSALFAAATYASAGAVAHGATLNLVFGSKVLVDLDLNALIDARDAHRNGNAELVEARKVLKAKKAIAYQISGAARDILKRSISLRYTSAWQGTGFTNSLRIPVTISGLEDSTRSLHSYLLAHPEVEVEKLQVTAADAKTAFDELVMAKTAVTLQQSATGALFTTRNKKEKALRRRLSGLTEELGRAMDPLDDRWTAFGLNKPGLQQTPNRPDKVSVTLTESDAEVKWEKTPRAEYYRIWLKVIGVDTDARAVGSPADLDFTIESLPAATQIEVSVSAINNGGESARSVPVVVMTT